MMRRRERVMISAGRSLSLALDFMYEVIGSDKHGEYSNAHLRQANK